jgi:hypothetical protein
MSRVCRNSANTTLGRLFQPTPSTTDEHGTPSLTYFTAKLNYFAVTADEATDPQTKGLFRHGDGQRLH